MNMKHYYLLKKMLKKKKNYGSFKFEASGYLVCVVITTINVNANDIFKKCEKKDEPNSFLTYYKKKERKFFGRNVQRFTVISGERTLI